MSEKKRVNSIARRMGRSWTRRLFSVFVVLDILLLLLAVGGYCYSAELHELGRFDSDMVRWLDVDFSGSLRQIVESVSYRFEDMSNNSYMVDLGDYLIEAVIPLFAILLGFELIVLLFQSGAGRRSANRLLKPLTQITRTAQRLSAEPVTGERYEGLEHAIENLSPSTPGAKLRTGSKELKGLEGAINDLIKRMHESYREQMRFVSDASHELRTPIAVIQGYSAMLNRWGKTDEKILDESIAAIQTEADHMNRLVEQLLFLARGDSGRTELQLETFDLSTMLQDVYEEYQMIDKNHEYAFDAHPGVNCTADQSLIKQVARILVDNAIKYTPEGGRIVIRVADGDVPSFQIQDNGIGINDEDVPRIFERFFRSDPSRDRSTGGTGLGLSIANWIVERHGGHFEVLSREGIGTRIAVFLPKQKLPEEALE